MRGHRICLHRTLTSDVNVALTVLLLLQLTDFMMTSPFLYRYNSLLFCVVLPGTDFIAQMLPFLNILFEAVVSAVDINQS